MSSIYWYLDIAEEWGPGWSGQGLVEPREWSAGPIVLDRGGILSVNEFLNKIQDAFNNAFAQGVAPRQYWIEARVRGMEGTRAAALAANTLSQQLTDEFNQATDNRELAILYKIYHVDGEYVKFTILRGGAGDGPSHGGSPPEARPAISTTGPSNIDDIPAAEITVSQSSDFIAFEMPYCTVSSTVTDRPPIPPDMVFVPFVGVNNKVLIMLNSGQGEKLEKPIVLRDSDMAFVTAEYESQHELAITTEATAAGAASGDTLSSTLLKLEYKNDDPIKQYEIFRIDTKPELVGSSLYPNFRNFNLTEQPIQTKIGPNKASTAASYVDTIVPNKKYWYCARSRDVHQNISNPTYIFEVEMVDNKGQMFLISKPYTVAPRVPKYKKVGRRYMAIRPRMSQTLFDPTRQDGAGTLDIDGEPDSSILGQTGVDSIWQQIFKIRVTSKKTGRKIDLNVTFKNTGVVTP